MTNQIGQRGVTMVTTDRTFVPLGDRAKALEIPIPPAKQISMES